MSAHGLSPPGTTNDERRIAFVIRRSSFVLDKVSLGSEQLYTLGGGLGAASPPPNPHPKCKVRKNLVLADNAGISRSTGHTGHSHRQFSSAVAVPCVALCQRKNATRKRSLKYTPEKDAAQSVEGAISMN